MPAAFVLGLGENGYGIVRALARSNVRVVGFYGGATEFGRVSSLCEAHALPDATGDHEVCRVLIEHAGRMQARPVLFPTSDRFAWLLSTHRKRLESHFLFHWVNDKDLRRIVDKAQIASACAEAGVRVPRTHVTFAGETPDELRRALEYPCLVKPNRSFGGDFPPGMKNFVAATHEALIDFYARHPALLGATLCQEIIEGGDENVFQCTVLAGTAGEPRSASCVRKLHQYPPGYGVMCFGRSEKNPVVQAQSLRLLHSLGYRGLASLEFKYRAADDSYHFIEMNPRLPWYNALFAATGTNPAHLAYLDLADIRTAPWREALPGNGVYWSSFKLDLGWFLRTGRPERPSVFSWLRSMAKARAHAWFDWRDPLPFLHALLGMFGAGRSFLSRTRGGAGAAASRPAATS